MRILVFDVRGQTLSKNPGCDFDNIIAGSVGYLRCKFNFYGNAFKDCSRAASFFYKGMEYAAMLDDRNTCIVPKEVVGTEGYLVSLTGVKRDYKVKTNKILIEQEVV